MKFNSLRKQSRKLASALALDLLSVKGIRNNLAVLSRDTNTDYPAINVSNFHGGFCGFKSTDLFSICPVTKIIGFLKNYFAEPKFREKQFRGC